MPEPLAPNPSDNPQTSVRQGWRDVLRYRPGKLLLNTLSGTLWQIIRLGCQALSIVIIARGLGSHGYGTLAGFGGLAVILGGLTGLGGGYLLLQSVSQKKTTFSHHWHATLHIISSSGLLLSILFLLTAPTLLHLPLGLFPLLAIAISELICLPLVYACSFAFQAHERLGWASALPACMACVRLLGAIAFLLSGITKLEHYLLFHLSASLLTASAAYLIVKNLLQPSPSKTTYKWADLRHGLSFSASGFTSNAQTELDKILTVRFLGAGPAGSYALAYRLITALAMPAASLALAAQPRMFRHAGIPNAPALRHMLKVMVMVILGYSLLAAIAVLLIAPLLIGLLGADFTPAVGVAQMLLPLLPLFGLRILAGILLSSLGYPAQRAGLELLAIVLLAGLSIGLMPRYGLTGTVFAVLGTESLLLLTLSILCLRTISKK